MKIFRDEATGTPARITMQKNLADMHQHFRQGDLLKLVGPMVAKRFAVALAMPNTTPPITREEQLPAYWSEITDASPGLGVVMTMYLTDTLNPAEVDRCLANRTMVGVKYYPKGLTTNSDSGVNNPADLWTPGSNAFEVLHTIAQNDGVLLIHAADGFASMECRIGSRSYKEGEPLDPYDQELHFIGWTLHRIREAHPGLKISAEHLSTSLGVEYLRKFGGETLGCSLTAQHLLLDRRDSFTAPKGKEKQAGFNPHRFWWPIIQPKEHRDELRKFAAEGHPFVWLGSDSAPHPIGKKLADCCTGGVLMAHAGVELYLEAFEDMGCLEKFEAFACVNGPAFFRVKAPERSDVLTFERKPWKPEMLFFGEAASEAGVTEQLVPFRLGEEIRWQLAG